MSVLDTMLGRPSRKALARMLADDVDYLDVAAALRDTAQAELADATARAIAYGSALMLMHKLADGDFGDFVDTYRLAVDAQTYLATGGMAQDTTQVHLRWAVLELDQAALLDCERATENANDVVEAAWARLEDLGALTATDMLAAPTEPSVMAPPAEQQP